MPEISWTMGCVITGAKVGRLVTEGKLAKAREVIAQLTSTLLPYHVEYLLNRVKDAVK